MKNFLVFQLNDKLIPKIDISSSLTSLIVLKTWFNNKTKQDYGLSNFEPFADVIFLTQEIKKVLIILVNALASQCLNLTIIIGNSLKKRIRSIKSIIKEIRDILGNKKNNIKRIL